MKKIISLIFCLFGTSVILMAQSNTHPLSLGITTSFGISPTITVGDIEAGTNGIVVREIETGTEEPSSSVFSISLNSTLTLNHNWSFGVNAGYFSVTSSQDTTFEDSEYYYGYGYARANDQLALIISTTSLEASLRFNPLEPGSFRSHIYAGFGALLEAAESGLVYNEVGTWPNSSEGTPTPYYHAKVLIPTMLSYYGTLGGELEYVILDQYGLFVSGGARIFPLGILKGESISVTVTDGTNQRTVSIDQITILPEIMIGLRWYF